jgi:hypothetical protein
VGILKLKIFSVLSVSMCKYAGMFLATFTALGEKITNF